MPEMDGYEAMRRIRERPALQQAADHRADRQGHEGRSRDAASRPAPATTCPSPSIRRHAALDLLQTLLGEDGRRCEQSADDLRRSRSSCCLRRSTRATATTCAATCAASIAPACAGRARHVRASRHLGELQHRLLVDGDFFASVLDDLTVQTSEMFRDPAFYRVFRERVVPHPAHLSADQDLARGLRHGRGGLLERDRADSKRGCTSALRSTRPTCPRRALTQAKDGVYLGHARRHLCR